jgi:hypothetical protein
MLPLSGETDGSVWDFNFQVGLRWQEICSACFSWLASSNAENVTSATWIKVVTDLKFKEIIDLHLRVKESGNPTLIPDFLIDLTLCTDQMPFLIVYTFITGKTPDCFCRCRVGPFPAPKLAKVMTEQGLGLDLMSETQHDRLLWRPVAIQPIEIQGVAASGSLVNWVQP